MAANYKELEKEARALSYQEKAELARALIEDLDATEDKAAEVLWLEELQRRYRAYKEGQLETISGSEAMQRARQRLK